jgi:hypothetical protein
MSTSEAEKYIGVFNKTCSNTADNAASLLGDVRATSHFHATGVIHRGAIEFPDSRAVD